MKIRHILIAFSFAAAVCFPLSVFSDVSNVLTSKAISTVTSDDADDIFDKTFCRQRLVPVRKTKLLNIKKDRRKNLLKRVIVCQARAMGWYSS